MEARKFIMSMPIPPASYDYSKTLPAPYNDIHREFVAGTHRLRHFPSHPTPEMVKADARKFVMSVPLPKAARDYGRDEVERIEAEYREDEIKLAGYKRMFDANPDAKVNWEKFEKECKEEHVRNKARDVGFVEEYQKHARAEEDDWVYC
ncbi:hypothetical protein IAR50_001754 [Cryptococcus sp. DSM 104548]